MTPARRRRLSCLVAAAALALPAGVACGNRSGAVGSGDDVHACAGIRLLDTLQEPRPDDRDEVLVYAQGAQRIVDRVDERLTFEDATGRRRRPTAAVLRDLATLGERFEALEEAVDAAEGAAGVRRVVNRFADDRAYQAADERLVTFYLETCPRD